MGRGLWISFQDSGKGNLMNIRALLLVLSLAAVASGQTFRGALSGTVTDPSGAALPEAAIKLDNSSTGLTRSTTSAGNGDFFFADLPLGIYILTVTHAGFETKKVGNIEVAVSKTTNINVQLGVAQQQQIVEVSATAVNLETTSSDLAAVVNTKEVQDLPINGRDFRQMIKLSPGVTSSASPSVNGTRTVSNNYQIDGADNNDAMFGGFPAQNQPGVAGIPGGLVPIDAIDQFSVQTNAGADMGRNSGSNVNMVIKSGTNQIHGTVYFFNRNEDLASPAPTLAPGSRPQEIRNNQPGFSVGGPVIKNKTFFFLTGEIQLAIAGESILDTSPSAAWVQAAGAVLAKYNVPVNPVSQNLLTIFPAASRTGPATANNYLAQELNTYNSYNGIVKLDHRFNEKHSLSVRYMGSTGTQVADVGSHFKDFFQAAPMHIHNYSLVENAILTPRLVNQLTLGVNYFLQTFQDNNIGFNPPALGLNTGITGGNQVGAPTINITGFDFVGATQPAGRIDTTGHVTDNLSYTRGRHQLKFGGEYRRAILDVSYFNNIRGTLNFDGTRGPWSSDSTVSSTLKALSDYLAGEPSNASGATINRGEPEPVFQINSFAWWAHDNFQVNPQLNINFGVRFDYDGVLHDSKGVLANFFPGQGFLNKQLYPKDLRDYAPRVGFAYSPKQLKKMVIRGGYGLFFDSQSVNSFDSASSSNGATTGIAYNPGGSNPVFGLNAQNVLFQAGVPVFGSTVPVPPFGAFSISQGYRTPYSQNFNLNIQTQLTQSTLFQVGYVGTLGRKLAVLEDINQLRNGVRPFAQQFPTLGAINQLNTAATSGYNSLQTSLHQQLWKGFTANVNYTWSHAIDTASTFTTPMNSYNLQLDKGDSTFDTRHILTGFVSYEAPQWAPFAPRLTKGWQFHALITYTSGSPINITDGKNIDQTGENKDRPNLVGDPFANVPVLANTRAVQYLNPAAFQLSPTGTYGNLGRDAIFGPGIGSVDFSVFKRTPITERIMSEFRVETLNLFNRTNWANPTVNFSSGSFGRLTNTRNGQSAPGLGFGEPRNVQLALKLIF
jgi:hypothetical protein